MLKSTRWGGTENHSIAFMAELSSGMKMTYLSMRNGKKQGGSFNLTGCDASDGVTIRSNRAVFWVASYENALLALKN